MNWGARQVQMRLPCMSRTLPASIVPRCSSRCSTQELRQHKHSRVFKQQCRRPCQPYLTLYSLQETIDTLKPGRSIASKLTSSSPFLRSPMLVS